MIDTMSPPVRKIIALCLLVLLLLFVVLVLIVPFFRTLNWAGARLDSARVRVERLEALAQRPVPNPGRGVPKVLVLAALDQAAASDGFRALLIGAAGRNGLELSNLTVSPDDPGGKRLNATFSASGPELSMVRFIQEIEQGPPIVRFRNWRLLPVAGEKPTLRFEGSALLVWSNPQ